MPIGPLIVVSGPSGVGKTTVVEQLLQSADPTDLPLRRAVTATTRKPRTGEQDGRDYHFWTPEQFEKAKADGEMLESAVVHGRDSYGTPRSEVDPFRAAGQGVILVIDVQGAEQVRAAYPGDHLSVFITPPNFPVLEARLRARGSEPEDRIQGRLSTAREELKRKGEFDRVIINAELGRAVQELEALIRERFTTGSSTCSTS